jgi:hypothetical protein
LDGSLVAYGVSFELIRNNLAEKIPIFIIGDNLYGHNLDLDRMLDSTGAIVFNRNGGAETARSFKKIQDTLSSKSIWIAQSSGRAKTGLFRSSPALVKGLERLGVQILPVRVNYEFEPTIGLMAYQALREGDKFKGEDERHMIEGLTGFTGKIQIMYGNCIRPKSSSNVTQDIDDQIRSLYRPSIMNKFALDEDISGSDYLFCSNHLDTQIEIVRRIEPTVDVKQLEQKILEFYRNNSY